MSTHPPGEHAGRSPLPDGADADGGAQPAVTDGSGSLLAHLCGAMALHPSVTLIVDPTAGAIVDANDAATRFYGLAREALLAAPLSHIVIDADTHRTAAGARREVTVQRGPISHAGRKLELWVVTHETAERQVNRDARQAAARLRDAERLASLGTWEADFKTGRVKLSQGLADVYRLSPEASQGGTAWFRDMVHPDDRADMDAWHGTLRAGKVDGAHAFRVIRPDGTVGQMRGDARVTLAADGTPERATGVVWDITAQVDAVRAHSDREERLQLAVTAGGHGLYDLDLATGDALVNDLYATMLGYDPSAFVETHQAWRDRLHPDDLERVSAAFDDYLQGRADEYRPEFRQRTLAGAWRWILSTGKIVEFGPDGAPRRMLGTHTDITALKQSEERVARHASRASALLQLPQLAEECDEHGFLQQCLAIAEGLTQSRISFVHFVNPDQQTMELAAWSMAALKGCDAVVERHYPVDQAGVWADAVRTRAAVVINDYATNPGNRGLPGGHAPLARFLTVPVIHEGLVQMVLGVGNRATEYESFDVETLRLFGERIWQIVAQRRTVAALAESAGFGRLLLENMAEGVVACDALGHLTAFNKAARAWHGAPADPLLAPERWAANYDLYQEDGVTPLATDLIPLKRAFNGEHIRDAVICISVRGQAPKQVLCSGGPMFDDAGDKVGALMVMHDISELATSRAKQTLQGAALDAAANAIVITDRAGHVNWANPAFSELTGYAVGEALGRKLGDLLRSGTHPQSFYADMWSTILDGRVWSGDLTNRRKDGTRYPEAMTITPVLSAHGEITHFIAIKRALSVERALQAQLLQSQKMESVGRLAGGIAHDFNNLLTVINGTAELGLTQMKPEDPLYEDLQDVRTAGARAAVLTRQLLAFSRQQILKREVIHLDEILRDLSRMLRRLIGEDIELVTHLERCGTVVADAGQIEQVVVNLVVNARDAMPTGGHLEIATREVHWTAADPERDPSVPPGRYVEVCVADSGTGMDADTQARLFEPFFTTKDVGKGTGLGLATVYGIINQTGGHILVRSEIGRGTRFLILLPQSDDLVAAPSTPGRAAIPLAKQRTVMVVDDESALRTLTERMLTRAGHKVLSAAGAADALRVLEGDDAPPIDLLLTDLVMPGMSGTALVAKLRQSRPDLRVLYMSGYTDDRVVQHGLDVDAKNLLNKPFTVAELTQHVREALEQA